MQKALRGLRYFADPKCVPFAAKLQDELPYLDLDETLKWYAAEKAKIEAGEYGHPLNALALLGCNDRFWLLTDILGREDLIHPWLFDRCREVEAEPDGHVDLWARGHGKSSCITFGGAIQEIICDPEITIAIFSVVKPIAVEFLAQIKNESETNDRLKEIYPDVFYANPKTRGADGKPSKWGLGRGITVKRQGRPKEATVEAHGLIDGQPTGRHFKMHIYDDVVTQDYLSDEQLKKTTARFEMADNLGTRLGVRKWIAGTRYHFADVYGVIMERGAAKARVYPATEDGTLDTYRRLRDGSVVSNLVLLAPENWERIKRDQGIKTTNAQMLLNPVAGSEATFRSVWLRGYEVVPRVLNVYILVDPSKGSGERSDRTAIAVVGIDPANNKYLLDGVCHRMRLTERWAHVKQFKAYWENFTGVQMVRVGWERYGMQVDIEVVEDLMMSQDNHFPIEELNTPKQGGHSKDDRIERLEPDIRAGRFYLPCVVHHSELGPKQGPFAGTCYWRVWTDEDAKKAEQSAQRSPNHIGQIMFRPAMGLTKLQESVVEQKFRIVRPLKRRDENKDVYDLTRVFIEEMVRHPFAAHDDFLDAVSRIYDIDPQPPLPVEAQSAEGIDVDDSGIDQSASDHDD